MVDFVVPDWVRKHSMNHHIEEVSFIELLRNSLSKFRVENPEVSIIIPAYNEEKCLISTLSSIAMIKSKYTVELIVVNNNSNDRTQEILDLLGVHSVFEVRQGVGYARQTGLENAKGKYILNADSDSIYPSTWVDAYVEALKNHKVSCVYGTYSFIPSKGNRLNLVLYEAMSNSFFAIKRMQRECVNVMGFNFAFRRDDGINAGGFRHDLDRSITRRCEDGWMALCLMRYGKIKLMSNTDVKVWTSDRRLLADGSIGKAFVNRVRKEFLRIGVYFNGSINAEKKIANSTKKENLQ